MAKRTTVKSNAAATAADPARVPAVDPIRARIVRCILAKLTGVTAESLGAIPEYDLRQDGSKPRDDLEVFELMAALEDEFGLREKLGGVHKSHPLHLSNIIALVKSLPYK